MNKELDEAIAALWNEPKSAGDIAKHLGVTRNNVMGRIWRMKRKGRELR